VFLGREITEQRNYSEDIARAIDEEVRSIIDKARLTATHLLTQYRSTLDAVAKQLMEVETLDAAGFEALFGDIHRPELPAEGPGLSHGPAELQPVPVPAAV